MQTALYFFKAREVRQCASNRMFRNNVGVSMCIDIFCTSHRTASEASLVLHEDLDEPLQFFSQCTITWVTRKGGGYEKLAGWAHQYMCICIVLRIRTLVKVEHVY